MSGYAERLLSYAAAEAYSLIVSKVSLGTGVPEAVIRSRDRARTTIAAQRIVAVCLREKGYSLQEIGDAMGGRNHSTIIRLLKGDRRYSEKANTRVAEAKVAVRRIAAEPKAAPLVFSYSRQARDGFEMQWREAVERYYRAPVMTRDEMWLDEMTALFPNSFAAQAAAVPRQPPEVAL